MGLNRSSPLPYAASAQKVLDIGPEWVLAEHGGPFEFNTEDFKRRVKWGEEGGKAADAMCVSGNHRLDWDPHRVHVEPVIQKAKPGATLKGTLVVSNPLAMKVKVLVTLEGRGLTPDQTWTVEVSTKGSERVPVTMTLTEKTPIGRQVFVMATRQDGEPEGSDAFVAVDVER
jgi:hypothetical protein